MVVDDRRDLWQVPAAGSVKRAMVDPADGLGTAAAEDAHPAPGLRYAAFLARGAVLSGTPLVRRIVIIGHQLVKADCVRFRPTNSVNHRKDGCT
jgi:hypothetical protein